MEALKKGKRVEGRLFIQEASMGQLEIVFKPYNRKKTIRVKDQLIRLLEHGWVKESPQRIKVYESIPKNLGAARVNNVLDREVKVAKEAIIDREIIGRV